MSGMGGMGGMNGMSGMGGMGGMWHGRHAGPLNQARYNCSGPVSTLSVTQV